MKNTWQFIDRTGEINYNNFGSKMEIIEYRSARDIDIYFEEYNWTFKHNRYKDFKEGSVICPYERRFCGVGYLGEGEYTLRVDNKETKCYQDWIKMLIRGYQEEWSNNHTTYKNCYVCNEWHNFQNFAKWYYEHYYEILGERVELDKDILIKGNKVYSPETCIFVPQRINKLFTKSNKVRGKYPIGVYYNKKENKFRAQLSILNKEGIKKRKLLGRFDTPVEAFNKYKIEKEKYIKQVADEYKKLIPQKLYEAMYNYEVEIND